MYMLANVVHCAEAVHLVCASFGVKVGCMRLAVLPSMLRGRYTCTLVVYLHTCAALTHGVAIAGVLIHCVYVGPHVLIINAK